MTAFTYDNANGSRHFWALLLLGGALAALGLGAAHLMELQGHAITGMNNQVVWGLPHVFAIFMIVAASGVLNVAAVASVFGQSDYKPGAPLSALLCLSLLAGGLMVLMLDLGRPDRILIAATHFNFRSVFAWNVLLYSGMAAIVLVYLGTMFERRFNQYTRAVGLAALVWRLVLTAGTGSIFGLLVARQAYGSALLAPLFIVLSLAWGLAVFLIVQHGLNALHGRRPDAALQPRLARLLGIFIAAALFLVAIQHLTSLYFARQSAFEAFILWQGGVYPLLFWLGYVLAGSLLPLGLLFWPRGDGNAPALLAASLLVVLGAGAWLYVFIIGGQAFPLEIFPGHLVSSSFGDGAVANYQARWPEWLLGLGGVGLALLLTTLGVRLFDVLPQDDGVAAVKGG